MAAYKRNPRKRVVRGSSSDELRRGGRRTSEELDIEGDDMPFVRLGSSSIGTGQDVVQRIGDAIIGGDFGGNARGEGAIDVQVERSLADRVASGLNAIAFGRSARVAGDYSMAFGASLVDADSSVGLGSVGIRSGADRSTAVGTDSVVGVDSYGSVLVGDQSTIFASSPRSILLGGESYVGNTTLSPDAVLLGTNIYLDGSGSVAIGAYSLLAAARGVVIGYQAKSLVDNQAVIAATALKMQTSLGAYPSYTPVYESVITTSASAPVTGNVATWADVDRIGDGGVALSALAPLASPTFTGVVTMAGLDVNADSIRIGTSQTPASASATGVQGEVAWDSGYVYVCIATDTWKRAGLSTW